MRALFTFLAFLPLFFSLFFTHPSRSLTQSPVASSALSPEARLSPPQVDWRGPFSSSPYPRSPSPLGMRETGLRTPNGAQVGLWPTRLNSKPSIPALQCSPLPHYHNASLAAAKSLSEKNMGFFSAFITNPPGWNGHLNVVFLLCSFFPSSS